MTKQCKDIPDLPILEFLRDLPMWDEPGLLHVQRHGCPWGELDNGVSRAMPDGQDTPIKLVLAKMGSLIKRGLVSGCNCGCRGEFELTNKARNILGLPFVEEWRSGAISPHPPRLDEQAALAARQALVGNTQGETDVRDLETKIRELLKGIDEDECLTKDGWWLTSGHVKFGAEKLAALLALVKGVEQDAQRYRLLRAEQQEPGEYPGTMEPVNRDFYVIAVEGVVEQSSLTGAALDEACDAAIADKRPSAKEE